jgi:hypothetical protein
MLGIDPTLFVQLAGFGVFLWVGLYLLVRASVRTPLIVVSAIGLFAQAAYFATGALSDTTSDLRWFLVLEQGFWWTTVLPAASWFHVSSLIARRPFRPETRRTARLLFTRLVVLAYSVALCLTLFGSIGDMIIDYSHPVQLADGYAVNPGVGYPVYMIYIAGTAAGALANLVRALRRFAHHPEPAGPAILRQLRLLTGGGLFFLIGGLWIAVRKYWDLPVSALPGFLCLFVGLMALAYSIVHFGMLLEGQNIRRDFIYSLTGIALMNLLYVGLLAPSSQLSAAGLLVLVGLVTVTHTAFDSGRTLFDRLFFNRDEQAARAEARDYATALAALPVATSSLLPEIAPTSPEQTIEAEAAPPQADEEKRFKDAVRRALTSLKSPPRLAQSQLLTLAMVERRVAQAGLPDNRLNRVVMLRELLVEQIEGLRPSDDASAKVGDAWRFYNVLYYPYVRELSRKGALAEARRLSEERRRDGQRTPGDLEQVLSWLADVDEDTFYKWQRRASDTIATMLWEENLKL